MEPITESAETIAEEAQDTSALARRFIAELDRADKWLDDWWKRADRVVTRYKDERNRVDQARRANLLWSNVQTLMPAMYARTPVPEVSRRFKDKDPVGRQAAMLIERSVSSAMEDCDFDDVMRCCVQDVLLPGVGVAWMRYEPVWGEPLPDGTEQKADEKIYLDYVYWKDFRWSPARTWSEVWWVARCAYMTRDELVERFGPEVGNKVSLDHEPSDSKREDGRPDDTWKKATIWEIWDKKTRQRIFLHKTYKDAALDVRPVPLDLHGFFPCPKPLFATVANDALIPVPDYMFYQDQAAEIDEITARIGKLVDGLRLVGFYAGSEKETLTRALQSMDDGPIMVPVASEAQWESKGGAAGLIQWMPLNEVVQALTGLYAARDQAKQLMYEITGISDIVRGATQASETATAQQIKAQWGSIRIRDRQADVQRFARDVIRLHAEIMAELFDPQRLAAMANLPIAQPQMDPMGMPVIGPDGQPVMTEGITPEVFQLLRDDRMRTFRVDIETDSTIQPDEQAEKDARVEFVTAMGAFLQSSLPVVQAAPQMAPMLGETLLFAVRGFRVGRQMEDVIEQTMASLVEQASQPPPPDPAAEEAKARLALDKEKMVADHELKRAEMDLAHKRDMTKIALDAKLRQNQQVMDAAEVETADLPEEPGGGDSQLAKAITSLAQAMTAPRKLVRDEAGRPVASEVVLQ